jgi:hypothetical protein
VVEFALLAPLMFFIMVGIIDLSRIYTAMSSVESAAREAADYATSLGAEKWSATAVDDTIAEMNRRACIAASDLPDYQGVDVSPADGLDEDCTNPAFDWCMSWDSSPCSQAYPVGDPVVDPAVCNNASRNPPCRVTVTMSHVFHLFVPFHIDFFGVELGLPGTLAFERDSTFAMTDIDVTTTPPPGP